MTLSWPNINDERERWATEDQLQGTLFIVVAVREIRA